MSLLSAESPAFVFAQSPPVDIVAKLREHVARFQAEAPSLVASENYKQLVTSRRGLPDSSKERKLVSELVMVRLPGAAGWISFRDVLEVDDRKVNDRARRLIDLLQKPSPSTLEQARALAAESARYNIGRLERTINLPDLALEFLSAGRADRISFSKPDSAKVDGAPTFVLRFNEHTGPSVVRTPVGRDVLVNGRVWVDAASAALVKTEIVIQDRSSRGSCVVEFAMDERLAIRVPSKMTERYETGTETIDGLALYSDYRRFGVSTDEKLIKPPPIR